MPPRERPRAPAAFDFRGSPPCCGVFLIGFAGRRRGCAAGAPRRTVTRASARAPRAAACACTPRRPAWDAHRLRASSATSCWCWGRHRRDAPERGLSSALIDGTRTGETGRPLITSSSTTRAIVHLLGFECDSRRWRRRGDPEAPAGQARKGQPENLAPGKSCTQGSRLGCCASIIGDSRVDTRRRECFETGPVFASVTPPLAKVRGFMDASARRVARGRAAVIRFYSTAEGRSATVQRDAPYLARLSRYHSQPLGGKQKKRMTAVGSGRAPARARVQLRAPRATRPTATRRRKPPMRTNTPKHYQRERQRSLDDTGPSPADAHVADHRQCFQQTHIEATVNGSARRSLKSTASLRALRGDVEQPSLFGAARSQTQDLQDDEEADQALRLL